MAASNFVRRFVVGVPHARVFVPGFQLHLCTLDSSPLTLRPSPLRYEHPCLLLSPQLLSEARCGRPETTVGRRVRMEACARENFFANN